jgi:hypothetical protein
MLARTLMAASAVAALVWLARPCAAMDPEDVYQAALADLKAGRFGEACPRFAEARRLKPDSTPALQGMAICFDKAGKTASAWARYRELSVEMKAHGDKDRADAASARADELARILSTVVISADAPDTPGLILRLDREQVPGVMFNTKMNIDPGVHVLEATAPGFEVWQTTVTVGEKNDSKQIKIPTLHEAKSAVPVPVGPVELPPSSTTLAQPSSRWGGQRIGGVVVAGAGLVSLAVGAAFGASALSQMSTSNQGCTGTVCRTTPAYDARQNAGSDATLSTATLVAGGALLAVGAVVFFTAPSGASKAPPKMGSLRIQVGPLGAAGAVLRAEGAF